jgi:hypothetical protein
MLLKMSAPEWVLVVFALSLKSVPVLLEDSTQLPVAMMKIGRLYGRMRIAQVVILLNPELANLVSGAMNTR